MQCTDVKLSPPSAAEKHIYIFLSSANWKKKKEKKTVNEEKEVEAKICWFCVFFSNQEKSTHFVAWTH